MSMTATTPILLCPGQGAQAVGMGKAWMERSQAAREVFAEADAILGFSISKLCFEGPENELNRTDMAQPAIFATTVACYRALLETGEIVSDEGRSSWAAAAGLSLGEFTALHIADAMDFDTGLRLVRLRGQAMQEAAESTRSGMVALMGCEEEQARDLCTRAVAAGGNGDVLVPANLNCPGQVVVSGTEVACDRALNIAGDMGMRAKALVVAGAFHSPVMRPAADCLIEVLEQADIRAPAIPVLSNVTARPHSDEVASIRTRLLDQLTHPVRWSASMQWLTKNIPGQLIELAPGKVLGGLMKRIDRQAKVENFDQPPKAP